MSGAVSRAAKPQLRGLLHTQIKKHLTIGLGLCFASGIAQHFLINEPSKKRSAEFFRTYDVEKDFIRMKNLGLLESCGPSD